MIIRLKRNKYFFTAADEEAKALFESLPIDAVIEVEIAHEENPKTAKQRKSLHVYLDQLAEILNAAGFDQCIFFKEHMKSGFEIPWTLTSVKDCLYKPILEAMTGKTSTEQMNTKEPSEICKVLGTRLSEMTGITPPDWPAKPSEADARYDNPRPREQ